MRTNPLTQRVNFFISATLIAAFGVLMVVMVLKAVHLENPIFASFAATSEYIGD